MPKSSTEEKLALLVKQAPYDRQEMLRHMLSYGETDLLCYRAPLPSPSGRGSSEARDEGVSATSPHPAHFVRHPLPEGEGLRVRQDALFDPILHWANATYRLDFRVTDDITPIDQPAESLAKLRAMFEAASDRELAALSLLTSLLGSVLLALALWKKQVTVEEAITASHLDEAVQAEQWGKDEEAEAAFAQKQKDIRTAAVFLDSQTTESTG